MTRGIWYLKKKNIIQMYFASSGARSLTVTGVSGAVSSTRGEIRCFAKQILNCECPKSVVNGNNVSF